MQTVAGLTSWSAAGRRVWRGSAGMVPPLGEGSPPRRAACAHSRGGWTGSPESDQQRAGLRGVQTQSPQDTGSAALCLPTKVKGQTVPPTQRQEARLGEYVGKARRPGVRS